MAPMFDVYFDDIFKRFVAFPHSNVNCDKQQLVNQLHKKNSVYVSRSGNENCEQQHIHRRWNFNGMQLLIHLIDLFLVLRHEHSYEKKNI